MRLRLLALLGVAALCGAVAGAVADAGTAPAAAAIAPARVPAIGSPSGASTSDRCPVPARYRAAFARAADDTGLPLALLVAVGQVESNLRHDAVSDAGARGILQVMPATARELALDVDRPDSNVLAGARYLRKMMDRFRSADLALAAYNAGPTAVDEAGGAPGTAVLTYVANVTTRWRRLTGCA